MISARARDALARTAVARAELDGRLPQRGVDGDRLSDAVRAHVAGVLERCGGNQSEAARRLGIDRGTLVRILRRAR